MTISEAQRAAILTAHRQGARADAQVVARNGLTTHALWEGACIDDQHRVTRRGLIEAGVDMDVLCAEALGLTPAEARTGISDRTAAALNDVAVMRRTGVANAARLDRIEQALRERR